MTLTVESPTTHLHTVSPIKFNPRRLLDGPLLFQVQADVFRGPRRLSVAQLYHPHAFWNGSELAWHTNTNPEYRFELQLPTEKQILRAACRDVHADFRVNDKGRQVQGVLARGGDVELFRRPETIDVIRALTALANRDLARELRTAREAGELSAGAEDAIAQAAAFSRLSARGLADIQSITGGDYGRTGDVLEQLVRRGLVKRGFEVTCSLCTLSEFRELAEAHPDASCRGCQSSAAYTSTHQEPQLFYQLTSLLARLSLNGGLAPLAATSLLTAEGFYVVPGVDVSLTGREPRDLDILGWRGTEVIAGEAKMSAGGFAKSDIEVDVEKSLSIGANVHLAVCTEPLDQSILDRLEAACKSRSITLRLLDREKLLTGGIA